MGDRDVVSSSHAVQVHSQGAVLEVEQAGLRAALAGHFCRRQWLPPLHPVASPGLLHLSSTSFLPSHGSIPGTAPRNPSLTPASVASACSVQLNIPEAFHHVAQPLSARIGLFFFFFLDFS